MTVLTRHERHDNERPFAKEGTEPQYPAHEPTRGTLHRNMARSAGGIFSVDSNGGAHRAVSFGLWPVSKSGPRHKRARRDV